MCQQDIQSHGQSTCPAILVYMDSWLEQALIFYCGTLSIPINELGGIFGIGESWNNSSDVIVMIVSRCLSTLKYQRCAINPSIYQCRALTKRLSKSTFSTTNSSFIIIHSHLFCTVTCVSPGLIQVNHGLPFSPVSS